MSDYISREKLSEKLAEAYNKGYITWGGNEIFKEIIAEIPSADVRENIQGHWIKNEENIYRCSKCGRTYKKDWTEDMQIDYPFCHCGANMRGE